MSLELINFLSWLPKEDVINRINGFKSDWTKELVNELILLDKVDITPEIYVIGRLLVEEFSSQYRRSLIDNFSILGKINYQVNINKWSISFYEQVLAYLKNVSLEDLIEYWNEVLLLNKEKINQNEIIIARCIWNELLNKKNSIVLSQKIFEKIKTDKQKPKFEIINSPHSISFSNIDIWESINVVWAVIISDALLVDDKTCSSNLLWSAVIISVDKLDERYSHFKDFNEEGFYVSKSLFPDLKYRSAAALQNRQDKLVCKLKEASSDILKDHPTYKEKKSVLVISIDRESEFDQLNYDANYFRRNCNKEAITSYTKSILDLEMLDSRARYSWSAYSK